MSAVSSETLASLSAQVQREKDARSAHENARVANEKAHAWKQRIYGLCSPAKAPEVHGEVPVRFSPDGGGRQCEGLLADRSSKLAVVVCHPWHVIGGSLYDPTVSAVIEACARSGLTTLRFNFRSDALSNCANIKGRRSAADLSYPLLLDREAALLSSLGFAPRGYRQVGGSRRDGGFCGLAFSLELLLEYQLLLL